MKAPAQRLLLVFPLLAVGLACAGRGSPSEEEVSTDTVEARTIPPDSMYWQHGPPLKEANSGFINQTGAPDVFLARGEAIDEAIKATWRVFNQGQPVDQPVTSDGISKSDTFWLVAFFGVAGSGPAWLVKSVEVSRRRIRVAYRWADVILPNDVRTYFVWAPVGALAPGTYALELYDEDKQYVKLLRRVRIPENQGS